MDMFNDMFQAIDEGRQPMETFYDGYVVNAIMDACYRSAKSRPPGSRSNSTGAAAPRRGSRRRPRCSRARWSSSARSCPDGRHKLILKDPASGDFRDRIVAGG